MREYETINRWHTQQLTYLLGHMGVPIDGFADANQPFAGLT